MLPAQLPGHHQTRRLKHAPAAANEAAGPEGCIDVRRGPWASACRTYLQALPPLNERPLFSVLGSLIRIRIEYTIGSEKIGSTNRCPWPTTYVDTSFWAGRLVGGSGREFE